MQNKIASLLILTAIFVNIFTISVFAETSPSIAIGSAITKPGETIVLPIVLENNKGFSNLSIEIGYDQSVITLTNVETASNVNATFTKAQSYTVNPYNMSWDSVTNTAFNGIIATLTFTVITDKTGTYPITIDYYKGRNGNYVDGDNVNYTENFVPLGITYTNGYVHISDSSDNDDDSTSESGISFSVTFDGDVSAGIVWAAFYDSNGKLTTLKQYPAKNTVKILVDTSVSGDYVKVMCWNTAMQPICKAQTISLR